MEEDFLLTNIENYMHDAKVNNVHSNLKHFNCLI